MPMSHRLWPSLATIDQQLFGCRNEAEANVPSSEISPLSDEAIETPGEIDHSVPPFIAEMIARRARAAARPRGNDLYPGRILAIPPEVFPQDAGPEVPIMILLDHEDAQQGIWLAWVVSSETDYAGWQDLVIDEEDNLDPAIGIVQAWNPLSLRIPEAATPMGALPHDRLAVVRLLAHEAAQGIGVTERARPGHVAVRRIGANAWGTTGTPIDRDDPRRSYRMLYRRIARRLTEACNGTLKNEFLQSLVDSLFAFARNAGLALAPAQWIPDAMGYDNNLEAWRIGENLEAAFIPATHTAVNLRFRVLKSCEVKIALVQRESVLEQEVLSEPAVEVAFTITPGADMALRIATEGEPDRLWQLGRI